MLFHELRLRGLLSFGPQGIELPMAPLNVLIGPNGCGKSNLLEALALFKAAATSIGEPIARGGGVREWLWKGPGAPDAIAMEAVVEYPRSGTLEHSLSLIDRVDRPAVSRERVELPKERPDDHYNIWLYCRPPQNEEFALELGSGAALSVIDDDSGIAHFSDIFRPDESFVSYCGMPFHPALWHLKQQYELIRLYRDWSFGPGAKLRQPCYAHVRRDFLEEDSSNLPLVLSQLEGEQKRGFLAALGKLFDGIVDVRCPATDGLVSLFLEEAGNRSMAASRLSDGTLRYLCLLAVLLHPQPPPLIAIEEPELGLHPDLLPTLADLMVEASQRSQLVVTTHSDVLVDALTERPECVVVCEKHDGATQMRRLDKAELAKWLEEYRLGELWTSGELGGNRW